MALLLLSQQFAAVSAMPVAMAEELSGETASMVASDVDCHTLADSGEGSQQQNTQHDGENCESECQSCAACFTFLSPGRLINSAPHADMHSLLFSASQPANREPEVPYRPPIVS